MKNISRIGYRVFIVLFGCGLAAWFGVIQAHAVQSFVETATTGGQRAIVNAGMDTYDPRVLSITFSAAPPDEPGEIPPEPALFTPNGASVSDAGDVFFALPAPPDLVFPLAIPEPPSIEPCVQEALAAPEPSSLALAVIGLAGIGFWLRPQRVRPK